MRLLLPALLALTPAFASMNHGHDSEALREVIAAASETEPLESCRDLELRDTEVKSVLIGFGPMLSEARMVLVDGRFRNCE